MDGEPDNTLIGALSSAAPEFIECPDCNEEFRPGHRCRESMIAEVERTRAAFQVAITTLVRIRNTLIIWRRGTEVDKLREVSALARKALGDIEELVAGSKKQEQKGDKNGEDGS